MFKLTLSTVASAGLLKLKRSEPTAYKKAMNLLEEIEQHPTTGTGKPERLRGNNGDYWSRRINSHHRLIYSINDETVTVFVLSSFGHYDDK